MAVKGMIGAVYIDETAPISENVSLLFDWTLEVQHRKEYTYGPELHAATVGWHVTAKAYWAPKTIQHKQAFVRLFIGKGNDRRCLTGQVELPALKQTEDINEMEIRIEGIGPILQEG